MHDYCRTIFIHEMYKNAHGDLSIYITFSSYQDIVNPDSSKGKKVVKMSLVVSAYFNTYFVLRVPFEVC